MFKVKKLLVLLVCLLTVVALAGCGGKTSNVDEKNSSEGSITVTGSTSVQSLSEELVSAFEGANTGVSVNIMGGGSSQGIQSAANGSAQIGASSRELKEEEKS